MHKLRVLRLERGLSQDQLGQLVPCSQSSIDRYERRLAIPGRHKMARLIAIFEGRLEAADFYATPTDSAEAAA